MISALFQNTSLAALVRYFQKNPRSQISTYQHRSVLLNYNINIFQKVSPGCQDRGRQVAWIMGAGWLIRTRWAWWSGQMALGGQDRGRRVNWTGRREARIECTRCSGQRAPGGQDRGHRAFRIEGDWRSGQMAPGGRGRRRQLATTKDA